MEKAHATGKPCLIRTPDNSLVDEIDKTLWTYKNDSFLPHCIESAENANNNAIVISHSENNPNGARILMMLDGAFDKDLDTFDRVLFMFNGNDDNATSEARNRWKAYKSAGHECTYWQQTENGGWQQK